jgi:hypothetical protein
VAVSFQCFGCAKYTKHPLSLSTALPSAPRPPNDRPGGYNLPMDEDIAPDIAPRDDEPLDPAEAVRRERDKYGDDSTSPNRDDQFDEHHGEPEDIP